MGESLLATNDLGGAGILRNPQESSEIWSKYRNSFQPGIPAKNSSKIEKKQEFLRPPPKPRSSEKFLRKTQEKKRILRNPERNVFLGPKKKFLKIGITNLALVLPVLLSIPASF